VIELRVKYHPETKHYESLYTPETARALAEQLNEAAGRVLEAGPGVCVYGCQAQGRALVVVQNLWPQRRALTAGVDLKAAKLPARVTAVSLNDNSVLETRIDGGRLTVTTLLGPWDAALILLAPGPG
jgi:hypothetical protein